MLNKGKEDLTPIKQLKKNKKKRKKTETEQRER